MCTSFQCSAIDIIQRSVFVAFILLMAISTVAANHESESTSPLLYCQDFKSTPLGQPPVDAVDNSSWAGGKVNMKVVATGDPKRARALHCNINSYGQIALGNFQVKKGKLYRVSFDAMAKGGATLKVVLRMLPAPWTYHIESDERVFDEFQTVSFIGRAQEDSNDMCVMIIHQGSLNLHVANIKVEEMDGQLMTEAPPVVGNLALNGSFELGGDGMFVRTASPQRPTFPKINDAPDGNHVMEMYDKNTVSTTWMKLSFQSEYIIRVKARAINAPGRLNLSLVGARAAWTSQAMNIQPSDGWKSISVQVKPQAPKTGKLLQHMDAFVVISTDQGPIQVDTLEVLANMAENRIDKNEYAPHCGLEMSIAIDPSIPMGAATVGEEVPVKIMTTMDIPSVKLQRFDEKQQLAKEYVLPVSNRQANIVLKGLEPGYWFLKAVPAQDNLPFVPGESFLCVVPKMPEVSLDQWVYGAHIINHAPLRKAAWKLGFRWDRLHDTGYFQKWAHVQPNGKDQWDFHDDTLNDYMKDGFAILANLDEMPSWVPHRTDVNVPPYFCQAKMFNEQSLPYWETYVRRVVEHYQGKIKYYEVCNEPHIPNTTPEEYLRALKTAYGAIKSAAPDAVVVGLSGIVLGDPYVDQLLKAGVAQYCDAVSFHGYGLTTWAMVEGPDVVQKSVQELRQSIKEAGGNPNMPIWDTETGWSFPWSYTKYYVGNSVDSPFEHAKAYPKSIAGAKAVGLARVMYYFLKDDDFAQDTHHFRAVSVNDTVRMPMQSMAVAISMLEGRQFLRQNMNAKSQGIVHYVFGCQGETVHMMWAIEGKKNALYPEKTKKIFDMWGREIPKSGNHLVLDQSPVYLLE